MTSAEFGFPRPDAVCDGGDLDCGSGLLLIIRQAMSPLASGGILEVKSRETSVKEDLPAWCRMVGHQMLGVREGDDRSSSYFLKKKSEDAALGADLEKARAFVWRVRAKTTGPMQSAVFARNHTISAGQPASFDTNDPAPSAIELLIGSLASSILTGFRFRASQKGIEIDDAEISLAAKAENILVFLGTTDEGSPGIATIEGKLFLSTSADEDDIATIFADTLRRCPIARTLDRSVKLQITVEIV